MSLDDVDYHPIIKEIIFIDYPFKLSFSLIGIVIF